MFWRQVRVAISAFLAVVIVFQTAPLGIGVARAAESDEFGRFEDLTRKLVNTPKPKPDEDES